MSGKLASLAKTLGCPDVYGIPDGVGGRFSVFTAVGLLPASLVGIDVVRLLEGAAAMTRRFRESPISENPVLQYVAVCHLAEKKMGATIRVLSSWSNQLESVGLWYDQLLSESLGKDEKGRHHLPQSQREIFTHEGSSIKMVVEIRLSRIFVLESRAVITLGCPH